VKGPRRSKGDPRNRLYGATWRKEIRPAVLLRDNYECQVKLPRCTKVGTCVDHIVPPDEGGAWYDMANLRASCRSCNAARARGGVNASRRVRRPSREW
jgi:5-methylcytosine-specific restriction enzyme A